MNIKGASGAAIAGILIVVIILVVIYYGVSSGKINLGKTSSAKPTVFSISANINSTSIYSGHSAPLYLTFFNPFDIPINAQFQISVGAPDYVSVSPSTKTIDMPADMSSPSVVLFNVSCLGSSSGISSTYVFSSKVSDIWQNLTTSVITYPYNVNSALIPQDIYNNSNQGFLSVSANPVDIETQIPSASLSRTMNVIISPSFDGGEPYTQMLSSSPNDEITDIKVTITNQSGIASASAYYDGQTYPFAVSGKTLTLSLSNVNLALIDSGLPLNIVATDSNSTSQNPISVDLNYNYYFSFTGSPSQISCS